MTSVNTVRSVCVLAAYTRFTKCSKHSTIAAMATMNAASQRRVFVYGTLKTGEPNHHVITDSDYGYAEFLGNARTVKKFPLLIASQYNIPYLLNQPGTGHRVSGEVYLVDDRMLAILDDFENHPNYYKRQLETVEFSDGITVDAWVYILSGFREELLTKPFLESYSSKGPHGLEYVTSESTDDPEDIYK